jgi:hypothetical protein
MLRSMTRWSLSLVVATAVAVSATGCQPAIKGGDLTIGGSASEFSVSSAVPFPNTQHRLKLTILNVSLDADSGAFEDFAASCEVFGTDAFGGNKRPITTLTASGLAVRPANTRDVLFDFQVKAEGGLSDRVLIDCMVDPRNDATELNEQNNRFSFLFRTYCLGDSDPCPGPVQNGGAVTRGLAGTGPAGVA